MVTESQQSRFLSTLDVLALHNSIMERTGFPPAPLRSEEALERAVMRPRAAAYYDQADLVRQCALLAVGIVRAEAFLDGNKRTAYAAADVFLRLNELVFSDDPLSLAQQLEQVAARTAGFEEAVKLFEDWLR